MNRFLSLNELTLTQPFDTLIGLLLLVSIILFGNILSKKINFHESEVLNTIIISCLIIIFISFIFSFITLIEFNRELIRYLIWFLITAIFFYSVITKNIKIKKIDLNENFIFLFIFFLLALIPATDADSLDYHLGFPLDILRNGQFIIRDEWFHSKLSGLGEYLILFGLSAGSKNFGQIINYFGLFIIFASIRYLAIKYNSKFTYQYFIFSTPLIVWLTASQKLSLFSSSLICLVLVFISTGEIIRNKKVISFSIICLIFCVLVKISNLIPALIIFLYLSYMTIQQKNFYNLFKTVFFSLLLLVLPYFLRNYYLIGDIYYPVFEYFKETKDLEFLEFYKSLTLKVTSFYELEFKDYFLIPLYYTLPLNVLRPTILLGLGAILLYPVLFKIKFFINKFEFLFIFFIMFYIILIPSVQPRYFLEAYWSLLILIIKYDVLRTYGSKFILSVSIILRAQSYFIFLCVLIALIYILPGSFNEKYYKNVMKENAYNYNLINWIYENVPENALVVSDAVRSHSLYKNNFISREGFFRKKDLIKESLKLKISHFILDENNKKDNIVELINACGNKESSKLFSYKDEVRNRFSKLKNIKKTVILYENKCL